jgi:hypothetical protein
MNRAIFPTACWPNLQYFIHFLKADAIEIEQHDNFEKQTYRNRCVILSANGVLPLTVPVVHTGKRQICSEVRIFYGDRWQARHWGALTSAYRRSPYFEFFEDEIHPFYKNRYESLLEQNLMQLETVFKLLRLDKIYKLTDSYEDSPSGAEDLRWLRFAERSFKDDPAAAEALSVEYYQTFGHKSGFFPNLSILDLLFNQGLKSLDYLKGGFL